MDMDTTYQSGMEAAQALEEMDMPDDAQFVRDLAEKMRDTEIRLRRLIAKNR